MVLTHIDARPGEVLVRLPSGETRWVSVSELIRLAESDKRTSSESVDEPKKRKKASS